MCNLTDEASILLSDLLNQLKERPGGISVERDSPERLFYEELKSAKMVECLSKWGQPVAVVTGITPRGIEHINALKSACAASGYPVLSLAADRVMRAATRFVREHGRFPDVEPESDDIYRELSAAGMLKVFWADDTAYALMDITDLGMRYVATGIVGGRPMDVNISPVFNNIVSASADASSSMTVTVAAVFRVIEDSNLGDKEKDLIKEGIGGIEEASEERDKGKFLEALEKVASIAKNSTDVAGVVLPLIMKYLNGLAG